MCYGANLSTRRQAGNYVGKILSVAQSQVKLPIMIIKVRTCDQP